MKITMLNMMLAGVVGMSMYFVLSPNVSLIGKAAHCGLIAFILISVLDTDR